MGKPNKFNKKEIERVSDSESTETPNASRLHSNTDDTSQMHSDSDSENPVLSIERHFELSKEFEKENDLYFALEHILEAWQLANDPEEQDLGFKAEVLKQLAHIYLLKQQYNKLEEYSEVLLKLSIQLLDAEKEVWALSNLAIARSVGSDYKAAMPLFLEALQKSTTLGLRNSIANCLVNIGNIYANLFNYPDAFDRYFTVLNDYEDVLSDNTRTAINLNLGNLCFVTDEYDLALDYFEKALVLARTYKNTAYSAQALAQISKTHLKKWDSSDTELPSIAIDNAHLAADLIASLEKYTLGRQINLLNLAQISFHSNRFDEAIELAMRGVALARILKDNTSELRGFSLLSDIYKKKGNYKRALHCQTIYSAKQAEHLKKQRDMFGLDIEIRYSIREKEQKIEELVKQNQFQAIMLEQSSQIAKQNRQLLQANEELRQFAYIASHDLKEPLRMIGSFTQIIQQQYEPKTEVESSAYFRFVSEGVSRMNSLLDALLQYATIGRTEIEKEPVDIAETMVVVRNNLRLKIEETQANILCGALPTIQSVPSLMIQMFQNLVSNALKFAKEGARPIILINAEETPSDWVFTVEDNGIGIEMEHKERIFVIFQRLHTRSKYEGTGIGLSICHKVAVQHGGKIWVESELGQGSKFKFTIPK
jgi:signal transduction histidine kinase